MSNIPYTESEEYQQEIAEQYKKRIGVFDPADVAKALGKLSFDGIKSDTLKTITPGNMNATYVTEGLVIKVGRGDKPSFLSNKIVSEKLSGKAPVVKVLAYDYFQKTPFEILVMERAPGNSLLEDMLELSQEELKDIFRQILQTINQMCQIKFESFGWLNFEGRQSFPSFADFFYL